MATKTTPRQAPTSLDLDAIRNLLSTPPRTLEDQLLHIQALGKRVDGYVQFMCAVGGLNGSSAEAKQRAVAAFHERLASMEQALGRIQEELRLG